MTKRLSPGHFGIAVAVAGLLAGCAELSPETRAEETVYQVARAFDAAETYRIACYPAQWYETNPYLGVHPARAKIAAWAVLGSVGHLAITHYLATHDAPPWLLRTWEGLGIGLEVYELGENRRHGLRP